MQIYSLLIDVQCSQSINEWLNNVTQFQCRGWTVWGHGN